MDKYVPLIFYHQFLVVPGCPTPLLGRDLSLLFKSCSYCSPDRRCFKTHFWGQTFKIILPYNLIFSYLIHVCWSYKNRSNLDSGGSSVAMVYEPMEGQRTHTLSWHGNQTSLHEHSLLLPWAANNPTQMLTSPLYPKESILCEITEYAKNCQSQQP